MANGFDFDKTFLDAFSRERDRQIQMQAQRELQGLRLAQLAQDQQQFLAREKREQSQFARTEERLTAGQDIDRTRTQALNEATRAATEQARVETEKHRFSLDVAKNNREAAPGVIRAFAKNFGFAIPEGIDLSGLDIDRTLSTIENLSSARLNAGLRQQELNLSHERFRFEEGTTILQEQETRTLRLKAREALAESIRQQDILAGQLLPIVQENSYERVGLFLGDYISERRRLSTELAKVGGTPPESEFLKTALETMLQNVQDVPQTLPGDRRPGLNIDDGF